MSLVQKMVAAARLDVNLYESVEKDESATSQAMTVVVISALAAGVGALRNGIWMVVLSIIAALIGWVIWAFLSYIIGTKILPEPQTDADLGQLLRTTGFAQAPGVLRVLGIIPVLGPLLNFLIGIWMLVATVIAIRQALDYKSTGRAIGVAVIGWVVFVMVGFALAMLGLVGAGAAGFAGL